MYGHDHGSGHLIRAIGTLSVYPEHPGGVAPQAGRSSSGLVLPPAQRQFLAAMVAFGPQGAEADKLADLLWFDELPQRWRPALAMRATRLRRSIGFEVIPLGRFRLDLAPAQVDVWHLLELAADDRPPTDAELCWGLAGDPYPDIELTGPLLQAHQDARRAQKRLAMRFSHVAPAEISDAACSRLERLVSSDPIDADVAVAVGRCLYGAGRRADALQLLQRFTAAHADWLGVDPPRMVADLRDEIARGVTPTSESGLRSPSMREVTTTAAAIG